MINPDKPSRSQDTLRAYEELSKTDPKSANRQAWGMFIFALFALLLVILGAIFLPKFMGQ